MSNQDRRRAATIGDRAYSDAGPSLLTIGIILGIGIAGTLDEVILHQLLQWHNLYVHTTTAGRLVSDGIFHLFSSTMLVLGSFLLWRKRATHRRTGDGQRLFAGILFGAGGFNLYDGTVQHKLLQLHPVREGVDNILVYDLVFNGIALAVVVCGWLVWRNARRAQ